MDSPSLWPIRQERRHVAMRRDFARIEDQFSEIESSIASISSKVNVVLSNQSQLPARATNASSGPMWTENAADLHWRLERLEFLLFQASFSDFAAIDESIQCVLPNAKNQLDCEKSPEKLVPNMCTFERASDKKVDKIDDEEGDSSTHPINKQLCLHLEMSSEYGDVSDATDSEPHLIKMRADQNIDFDEIVHIFPPSCMSDPYDNEHILEQCVKIAFAVRDQATALNVEKNGQKLEDCILGLFGSLLDACPRYPNTKVDAEITRRTYENHDRHSLWSRVCNKLHQGIGDPQSKSYVFLKAVYIIHCYLKQKDVS